MKADCCPYCGCKDLDVSDTDNMGDKYYEYVYCMNCDGTWSRVYVFSHFKDIKGEGK